MFHDLRVGRLAVLQHVLDEIDAAAWRIEFITQQQISRTRGRAKPAMHACAQDFLGFRDIGIGELVGRKVGLHDLRACEHTAGVENMVGIESVFHSPAQCGHGWLFRLKDIDGRTNGFRGADQRGVAISRNR